MNMQICIHIKFMNTDHSYKIFNDVFRRLLNILYWICTFPQKKFVFTADIMSDQVIFGRQHVGIMSAESVGNYGVR